MRRRIAGRCRPLVLGALIVLVATPPAHGQDAIDPFLGQVVADVRLHLEDQPLTDPALVSLLEVSAGEPLSVAAVRETVDHFARLPQFENVTVLAALGPAGITLTFRLSPRHPIDRFDFRGDTGLPRADLEQRLRDQHGGFPPPDVNLGLVAAALERHLAQEGFLQAAVTATIEATHDPDRATLVLDVTAGPRATIATVEVVNDSPLSDAEIIRRTTTSPGQPYRSGALVTALAGVRNALRSQRYYAAQARSQSSVSPDRTAVDLTLVVEAGSPISVEFAGDPPPDGDVEDYVPVQREGAADEDLLEDADLALREALRSEGYRDARVSHASAERDGETVITFTIERGRFYRIERIEVPDGLQLTPAAIRAELGLEPRDPLDAVRVEAGMVRVLERYWALGFYLASAEPQYEEIVDRATPTVAWVILHPNITEGPQGRIADVAFTFSGEHAVAESDLRSVMRSRAGAPYYELDVYRDRLDLETFYQDRGFRTARVEVVPEFSPDGRDVTLRLGITEGPQLIVSQITVVGNRRVSEASILDQLAFQAGDPYGQAAITESRRSLAELGIGRTTFDEQPRLPGDNQVHVIIAVEETPAVTVGLGGGLEVGSRPRSVVGGGFEDQLEVSPRGFFEIGRRHLGGRNRSINVFARVAFKPRNAPGDPENDGKGFGFNEYRVTGSFREGRAFDTDTDLLIGLTAEQAIRTSYNFIRYRANAEFLRQLTNRFAVAGRYSLDFTKLFDERIPEDEQPLIDRLFPQVRLSIVSMSGLWDSRDSPIAATEGSFFAADVETALRQIGSEVGYVKTFLQASTYLPLTDDRRVVFATRAQLGLARGFERDVPLRDVDGEPILGPTGAPLTNTVENLPASQRFFSGGSRTVRGFQLDRLGVPEILNQDGFSVGGNGVFVVNAELRSTVASLFGRGLAVVGFVDGGNVFEQASNLDLTRLRGTGGFGVRYDSPIGPLRVDFGFKMKRLVFNNRRESGWELHLSIGEAF